MELTVKDGQVKLPVMPECASVRICGDGVKTTVPYRGSELVDVKPGNVIEMLSPGSQVICSLECVVPFEITPLRTVKGVFLTPPPLTEEDLQELRERREWVESSSSELYEEGADDWLDG